MAGAHQKDLGMSLKTACTEASQLKKEDVIALLLTTHRLPGTENGIWSNSKKKCLHMLGYCTHSISN